MHLTGYYRMGPSLSPLHRHILRNVSTLQARCVALRDGGPETIRFNAKHVTDVGLLFFGRYFCNFFFLINFKCFNQSLLCHGIPTLCTYNFLRDC